MDKIFITAEELLADSFELSLQIYENGFEPDIIIGIWRGGAPVAIAVHEMLNQLGKKSDHFPVRAKSYIGISKQNNIIELDGFEYVEEKLKPDMSILLVDDVLDSGKSIEAIIKRLTEICGDEIKNGIKIAVPWYKPGKNKTTITPDFYLHSTESWIVFPHELSGLNVSEIIENKPVNEKLAGLLRTIQT